MKKKAILKDLWIVVLDIIAVNLSYFLAIFIRFYRNGMYQGSGLNYVESFYRIAPWYTVVAIVIFFLFRLYGGMWVYAGLNDMNRIIFASLTASVVHVIGSLIFVKRMPITYYVIGAVLQLVFLIIIRFSYRVFIVEKKRMRRETKIPAVVIGSGDLARKVIKHLLDNTPYKPTVILSRTDIGRTLDGISVLALDQVNKAEGKIVFIADEELDGETRDKLNSIATEVKDYTGALSNLTGDVPVTGLMEKISSPVTIVIEEKEKNYKNGIEVLEDLHTKYIITDIKADKITVSLKPDDGMGYLKQHAEETGEEISFF